MILKFAIGDVPSEHEAAIREEEDAYGAFLRIPIEGVSSIYANLMPFCFPMKSQRNRSSA